MSPHQTFTRIPLQVGSELRIRNNGEISVSNPTIEARARAGRGRCGDRLPLRPADRRACYPAGRTPGAPRQPPLTNPPREGDCHRASVLDHLAHRRKPSARRIRPPRNQRVGLFVGRA